jgi:hypothetical protein
MKVGDNIVILVDGDIRSAEVKEMLPNGDVLTSIRDYCGDYVEFPRRKVFTTSEWEQVKYELMEELK